MQKALFAVVVVLILVIGFGAWLWHLGAPPTLAASVARLEAVQGSVETRSDATSAWGPASEGQAVQAGSHIRTGADGSVTLTVSGVSQTRLSTSTELSVDTLVLPTSAASKSQTGLTLVTGRTWSRIVRLLELDSSYTVTTDDVVATVRGTTFETARLPGKETWISVFDGKVKAGERVMEKGMGMMKPTRGTWRFVTSSVMIPQNKAWIETNVQQDAKFLKDTQAQIQTELTKDVSTKAYDLFGDSAERFRMALTDEKLKADLADQYLSRRLAIAKELQENGEVAKATETLQQIKNDMQAWTAQTPLDKQAELFKQTMMQGSILYHDAPLEIPTQFLKDRIDTLKTDLLMTPPEQLPIDLQKTLVPLKEVPLILKEQVEQLQKMDLSQPPAQPTPDPTIIKPTDDLTQKSDSIDPRIPAKLILSSGTRTLRLKESARVMAVVIFENGTRADITPEVTLTSSDPSIALVNGNVVQSNERPGSVTVTGSYRLNGVTVTGSTSFEIQP